MNSATRLQRSSEPHATGKPTARRIRAIKGSVSIDMLRRYPSTMIFHANQQLAVNEFRRHNYGPCS